MGTVTRAGLAVLAALVLATMLSCQQQEGLLTQDIVSYRITLKSPLELGSEAEPLAEDNPHTVVLDVEALGADGQVRSDYNADLNLWVFFEGTLSPVADSSGNVTVSLANGGARDVTRVIPVAFGPTTIWVDDVRRAADGSADCLGPYPPLGGKPDSCSYASGASATIHYRNPYLDEVQEPLDRNTPAATHLTLLQGKSVYVDHPRDLDSLLVVTGAYAQAFTVTDISPSAMARGFNHVYVFSFSRAKRNDGTAVAAGDVVIECPDGACNGYLAGGVKEFVGFTELDFPIFDVPPPTADAPECRCGLSFKADGSRCETKSWFPCPEPILLDPSWMNGTVSVGDAAGDLTTWSVGPMTDQNSTDGVVYGTWLQSGGTYVLTFYQGPGRTPPEQVSQDSYTPAGAPEWPHTFSFTGSFFGSVVAHAFSGDNSSLELHDDPNSLKLESLEAALVRIENARICTYDETDWTKYGQLTVDFGSGCNLAVAFKDAVPGFDPQVAPGQTVAEVVGTLRNLSDFSSSDPTQSYSYWILSPRGVEDVDCGNAAGCGQ
ncbi:MAG: hypothetical protein HY906_16065 [Deltaproteobacteria bacterium]|nr:hypothetical protein [Deltaproteobacteria bacterium]